MNPPSSKKWFCQSQINLPFPYPMLDLKNEHNWPFVEEGFLIASGHLNTSGNLVIINDLATILAFNKMGFFGIHSNREIIQDKNNPKNKPSKTVGFYSLKPIEIPSALSKLTEDMNQTENYKSQTKNSNSFNSLKLCLEEAYFLSFVFGLLKIHKNPEEYYTLEELWECFCRNLNNDDHSIFASRFAVYYYFRSHGYVVKNGFKFGVDYLLYEDGPPFNHSNYSVIIEHKIEGRTNKTLKFHEISGLSRITHNSHKELILCTVILPKPISDCLIISGPNCIKFFKIVTTQISRKNLANKDIDLNHNHSDNTKKTI